MSGIRKPSWAATWQAALNARSQRERAWLAFGGAFVGLSAVWSLVAAPLLDARTDLLRTLPELRQQSAAFESLAAAQMARPSVPSPAIGEEGAVQLRKQLAALGLAPQSLDAQGSQWQLKFTNIAAGELADWLRHCRQRAGVVVRSARLEAASGRGRVDAMIVLEAAP